MFSEGDGSRKTLRRLLEGKRCLVAMSAHDGVSARLAQQGGFQAVFVSGYAIQAAGFGKPNVGYASSTECVDYARKIATAVDIPVIMGAVPDHIDAVNVRRLAEAYAASGVAAMSIDDQVRAWSPHASLRAPMRPREETCNVIKSAREVAGDLILIASTYAMFDSEDAAIERCSAYAAAGADIVRPLLSPLLGYMGGTATYEERLRVLQRVVASVSCMVATHSPHGIDFHPTDLERIGVRLYEIHQLSLAVSARAIERSFTAFNSGRLRDEIESGSGVMPVKEISDLLGLEDYTSLARRFDLFQQP